MTMESSFDAAVNRFCAHIESKPFDEKVFNQLVAESGRTREEVQEIVAGTALDRKAIDPIRLKSMFPNKVKTPEPA